MCHRTKKENKFVKHDFRCKKNAQNIGVRKAESEEERACAT